jgi:predicted alpha-1,2-mannosidase
MNTNHARSVSRLALLLALALTACGDDGGPSSPDVANDATDAAPDSAADTGNADAGDDTGDGDDDDADVEEDADGSGQPPELLTTEQALERVNPFVGSGGFGFAYASGTPAAQLPVGFIKVGPDTTDRGLHAAQNHFSGYLYTDPDFRGFSHVRLVGTGAADLGNFRLLPLAALDESEPSRRYTRRDPALETARPGYYRAELPDEGVVAEMTAGNHSAVHRYTYDGGAFLQIDPTASITDSGVVDASIEIDGTSVVGWVEYQGGFAGRERSFTLHFDLVVSPQPTSVQAWNDDTVSEGTSASGTNVGLILGFPDATTVDIDAGFSLLTQEQAATNREEEIGDASLEQVAERAMDAWRPIFERIRIAGGTEREQRTFYSALYNAYRMPSRLDEPNGQYRGLDGEVHDSEGRPYYSDLSLWDTYRTLHPWYSLTDHTLQAACVDSLMRMGEQSARGVPRWPAMLSETGSMNGSSADIVFGDAAVKGVPGIDWEHAFELLHATAWGKTMDPPLTTGREGIEAYAELGYLPDDSIGSSVSKALEYSWDDFGLAAVARAAGLTEEAAELEELSLNFLNLIDDRGFMMPRTADGSWVEGISPRNVYMGEGPFTEGSAWHWRFYGVHAPQALADALADVGVDLGDALETFYAESRLGQPGPVLTTIPDPYYWHGNEPAIHAAALFHEAGRSQRAAHWVREIQDRLYGDTPDGLPGNDDGGTLSAWYLFTAIGLYPIAGSDIYYLNTPVFERVEIDLPDGTVFTVEAPGASTENRYWTSVTLDGVPVEGGRIRHADLSGAVLRFDVTSEMP